MRNREYKGPAVRMCCRCNWDTNEGGRGDLGPKLTKGLRGDASNHGHPHVHEWVGKDREKT